MPKRTTFSAWFKRRAVEQASRHRLRQVARTRPSRSFPATMQYPLLNIAHKAVLDERHYVGSN